MFDVPQILTNGKGDPVRSSMTVVMYLNNFIGTSKNYGRAGAVSAIMFVICAVLCVVIMRTTRGDDERKPKPEQLLKISQALGISINIFMDFDIHTVSDLLSLIFKMNEQLDLNFDSQKDTSGNIIPDTLTLSFKNPIINQKLSTYVSFLNKMTGSERDQYTQTLQELENQLLDDNTEIHKTASASNSTNNIPDSTFSDPSYQKIQNLLSDCTPQEMEWILKSVQLIKDCLRDTK